MNTAIFRDRADLILYADAYPPLTGQQRPGGGGGVFSPRGFSHTCPIWGSPVVSPPPPLFKANLQHYWVWLGMESPIR